jgi:hypothetical protein
MERLLRRFYRHLEGCSRIGLNILVETLDLREWKILTTLYILLLKTRSDCLGIVRLLDSIHMVRTHYLWTLDH